MEKLKTAIICVSDRTVPSLLAAAIISLWLNKNQPEIEQSIICVAHGVDMRALNKEDVYRLNPSHGEGTLYRSVWKDFFENQDIPPIDESILKPYFPDIYKYIVSLTTGL